MLDLRQDGRLPLPQAVLDRCEFGNLSLPFGIYVKGRNISVLIEFAIAATNKVFAAVARDLFPVIIIPTRIFDVTNIAANCFSIGIPDSNSVAVILQLSVVEIKIMVSP